MITGHPTYMNLDVLRPEEFMEMCISITNGNLGYATIGKVISVEQYWVLEDLIDLQVHRCHQRKDAIKAQQWYTYLNTSLRTRVRQPQTIKRSK